MEQPSGPYVLIVEGLLSPPDRVSAPACSGCWPGRGRGRPGTGPRPRLDVGGSHAGSGRSRARSRGRSGRRMTTQGDDPSSSSATPVVASWPGSPCPTCRIRDGRRPSRALVGLSRDPGHAPRAARVGRSLRHQGVRLSEFLERAEPGCPVRTHDGLCHGRLGRGRRPDQRSAIQLAASRYSGPLPLGQPGVLPAHRGAALPTGSDGVVSAEWAHLAGADQPDVPRRAPWGARWSLVWRRCDHRPVVARGRRRLAGALCGSDAVRPTDSGARNAARTGAAAAGGKPKPGPSNVTYSAPGTTAASGTRGVAQPHGTRRSRPAPASAR